MTAYDPITGDPIMHIGHKQDVRYDEDRDEWVSADYPHQTGDAGAHDATRDAAGQ